MPSTLKLFPLGLIMGLSFNVGCLNILKGHCKNNGGNAACQSDEFCSQCQDENNGCVAQHPGLTCLFAGEADGSSTSGIDSTTTETGVMTTNEVTSLDTTADSISGTTTGPIPCNDNPKAECPAEAPFCGPESFCVDCSGMTSPNEACAGIGRGETPICDGSECVECTTATPDACTGTTPICDDATNTCEPCTAHEGQCGEAACNLFTGACLPADAVVHVGSDQDFLDLTSAVMSFGAGAQGTIIVHEGNYTDSISVGSEQVLAFLAFENDSPVWSNQSNPSRQLTANNSTVILDNMQLSFYDNGGIFPVNIVNSDLWIDRSLITNNDGGGIRATGSELTVRNSFVEGGIDTIAMELASTTATALYSTITTSTFMSTPALSCDNSSAVEIRNSIILSQGGDTDDEIACNATSFIDSAIESTVGGFDPIWFVDFNAGNFRLSPNGAAVFADIATWHDSDPTTDIDGNLRPNVDGTPDHAGAHRPQAE